VAGVKVDKEGKIMTDACERTSAPHIYAIGDVVTGNLELTPVAIAAGRLLAKRLYNGGQMLMDQTNVATTVFTPLEYGCVGYSEEAALEKYPGEVEVYHKEFLPLEWTVPHRGDNVKAYFKMICRKVGDEEKVIGVHVLCPNAGEITQGLAIAIRAGATKEHFDSTIGIHPTVCEEIIGMDITKSSGESAGKGGC